MKSARGESGTVAHSPGRGQPLTVAPSPNPTDTRPGPLPRTRLTDTNYTLTDTNPPTRTVRKTALFLDSRVRDLLLEQAEGWAERHLPTSGIRHRPPVLSAYVEWLVRERERLREPPRADSGKAGETKRRYARSVAPWSPRAHRYDGPPKVARPELCLRRSLLTEFPKSGDAELRKRSLQAAGWGLISAVEAGEILDPLTLSSSEVGKLAWFKPADAERACTSAQERGG